MRKSLALLSFLLSSSAVVAQTQPAQMGITPTTSPEVLQTLDNTKTWVPIGNVNPTTHTFTPVGGGGGGEADILVTDPAVGMTANAGQDNSPLLPALMSKQSTTAGSAGGYDVTFPSIPGQYITAYYFSQPFVMSRAGNYHCSGSTSQPATWLIFAPGVDGVVQEDGAFTSDGGWGNGTISGCEIVSLGDGSATANTATPNTLTGVTFTYSGFGGSPAPSWHVGDSLILTSYRNGYISSDAQIPIAPGTTVTAIAGTTLTLSGAGITPSLGFYSISPHASVTFTETGSNNFSVGDTLHVGPNTYTFAAQVSQALGGDNQRSVLVGANFAASVTNLISAIQSTAGQYVTYQPANTGESAYSPDQWVNASYAAPVITFSAIYSGLNTNSFPAVYTHAGTAAGTFSAATFSGATAHAIPSVFWQLPATQEFKVQTSAGANSAEFFGYISGTTLTVTSVYDGVIAAGTIMDGGGVTPGTKIVSGSGLSWTVSISQTTGSVGSPATFFAGNQYATLISGPRLLHEGDVLWSDAFPFGAMVGKSTGTAFPETIMVTDAADTGGPIFATVTHVAGAEGNLWNVPAGIKRRTDGQAKHNAIIRWPIGEEMACNFTNCDLSRDEDNFHSLDLVGRWIGGSNTATAASVNEQFSSDYLMDVFEGGTLGEIYFNLNSESPEDGYARYGIVKNCANQNYSTVFGAYSAYGGNGCSVNGMLYPPTYGGLQIIGELSGGSNNGAPVTSLNTINNGQQFVGGRDQAECLDISGPRNTWYLLAFSSYNCGAATNGVAFGWSTDSKSWVWMGNAPSVAGFMRFISPAWSSTGYTGPFGTVNFPNGLIIGEATADNLSDDRFFGMAPSQPAVGSYTQGDTVINTAAAPGGTAAWYHGASQWFPAAPVASNTAGTSWTLGNNLKLAPVAIASLPTCNAGAAGTFAVVNNGAAPTYGGTVSTTGAVTSPVFCTGSGWTYH